MSVPNSEKLIEQIASLVEGHEQSDNFKTLRSSIEKINDRLDDIENRLNSPSVVSSPGFTHSSQEKFDVVEAIADQILEHSKNEKVCTFEPNERACDHCLMCSSRGF